MLRGGTSKREIPSRKKNNKPTQRGERTENTARKKFTSKLEPSAFIIFQDLRVRTWVCWADTIHCCSAVVKSVAWKPNRSEEFIFSWRRWTLFRSTQTKHTGCSQLAVAQRLILLYSVPNLNWDYNNSKYTNEIMIRTIIFNSACRSSRTPWILLSESLSPQNNCISCHQLTCGNFMLSFQFQMLTSRCFISVEIYK